MSESIGNRFKIWRSKQPIWMNIIIGWVIGFIDIIGILVIALIGSAAFALLILWAIQQFANAYSGQ